jgi:hypothetical protein
VQDSRSFQHFSHKSRHASQLRVTGTNTRQNRVANLKSNITTLVYTLADSSTHYERIFMVSKLLDFLTYRNFSRVTWHETTDLCHQDNYSNLSNKGRFSAHVRTSDDLERGFSADQIRVVRDERHVGLNLQHRVAS